MIRIYYFVLILLSVFACSDKDENYLQGMSSVNINVNTVTLKEGTTKYGQYRRGNAPAYIEGVILTVDNLVSDVSTIKKDFYFVEDGDEGGEQVVVENVTSGRNRITAKGIGMNNPLPSWSNTASSWSLPWVSDNANLDVVAADYSSHFMTMFPVYADYEIENPVDVHIRFPEGNDISINMEAKNHRVGIIFENRSNKYIFDVKIYRGSSYRWKYSRLSSYGNRYAVMSNDETAVGTVEYTIEFDYFLRNGYNNAGSVVKKFTANAGENITRYYRVVTNEPFLGEVKGGIQWVNKGENNIGKEI